MESPSSISLEKKYIYLYIYRGGIEPTFDFSIFNEPFERTVRRTVRPTLNTSLLRKKNEKNHTLNQTCSSQKDRPSMTYVDFFCFFWLTQKFPRGSADLVPQKTTGLLLLRRSEAVPPIIS